MTYVDGFIVAVHTAKKTQYRNHAKEAAAIFKEHGALKIVEAWGDDTPMGKITSFPQAVELNPHETVVFSWVTWPSKKARNEGWEKVIADPRMQPGAMDMPFDGKRMIYGGFEVILEL